MGESLNQIKHCTFPYISGQLLSLLYQDVCPTIRPITFAFLSELQSRGEKSSGENCYSQLRQANEGNGLGEGHLTTTVCVHVDKGNGGQKPLLDNMAPRQLAVWKGKGIYLARIQSNPVVKSTGSGRV